MFPAVFNAPSVVTDLTQWSKPVPTCHPRDLLPFICARSLYRCPTIRSAMLHCSLGRTFIREDVDGVALWEE